MFFSSVKYLTIFCSFPVTKTLEIAPHEDIAEENGDEIVGVQELDWSGSLR